MLYVADPDVRAVRISTTADRAKARNLARDRRAVLHVSGVDFWHFAVADGAAELSPVAATPDDDVCRELRAIHAAFYGEQDAAVVDADLIANRRLVVRLHVDSLYGVMSSAGRRPQPETG